MLPTAPKPSQRWDHAALTRTLLLTLSTLGGCDDDRAVADGTNEPSTSTSTSTSSHGDPRDDTGGTGGVTDSAGASTVTGADPTGTTSSSGTTAGEPQRPCNGPTAPSGDDCMGLGFGGTCDEHGRVLWCIDCATFGMTCGYVGTHDWYNCTGPGNDSGEDGGTGGGGVSGGHQEPPGGSGTDEGGDTGGTGPSTGSGGEDDAGGSESGGTGPQHDAEAQHGDYWSNGTCNGGYEPSSGDCREITGAGRCDVWGQLLYCAGGHLYCIDCPAQDAVCQLLGNGSELGCG